MNAAPPARHAGEDAAPALETVVLTRQPILDTTQRLLGYEILVYGAEWHNERADADLRRDNMQRKLMHAFIDLGVERLVGTADAFMRLPRSALSIATSLPINGNRSVIAVDGAAPIDTELVAQIDALRRKGFRVALESVPAGEHDALLQQAIGFAHYALFPMGAALDAEAAQRMRAFGLRVIVTGIDTREQLQRATALGCEGFQGHYLCEPEAIVSTSLRENKLSVLRLLAAIEDPNNGPVELDAIIRTDATLSYKVLRCVNSAYFSLPVKVRSVLHAVVYLGVNRIRNWIRMIAISGLKDCPTELLKFALIRGRMCELLAAKLPNDQREMAFTVGLFSLLDALLNTPLPELIARISVADEVRDALVERKGPLARLLDPVEACERGDWRRLEASSVPAALCASAYVDAVAWAENVFEIGDAEPA
jgi:EAL and modified HD-GYP domain-containing signal transduction protein